MKKRLLLLICSGLIGLVSQAQTLERVLPWEVGMDAQRLAMADSTLQRAVANDEIPGAVLAVVRHGKMAYLKAFGNRSVRIFTSVQRNGLDFGFL